MSQPWISLMIVLPVLGALLQAVLSNPAAYRWAAAGSSAASSILAFFCILTLEPQTARLQLAENHAWLGSFSISYQMGIDGLNILPVMLIALLFPVLLAFEWGRKQGGRGLYALLLLEQATLIGSVCAQDLFVLLLFWSFSALPFYFLIGIWGGQKRESAALRQLVTGTIGNAAFFAGLILLYHSANPQTFSIGALSGDLFAGKTFQLGGGTFPVAGAAFFLISMGLALRIPVWPLHGWFTQAAEEAPPSVMVALGGAAIPVGLAIFTRLSYMLFPSTMYAASTFVVLMGVVNLLAGGICALAQKSLRLLLAYTCLSQIGVVLVGVGSLSAAGIVGAIFQQLALGLSVAGFGLLLGQLMDRSGPALLISDSEGGALGGVAMKAPTMAVFAALIVATLLGFPGSAGFIGQALVVLGAYPQHPVAVAVAGFVFLLGAGYLFGMYRAVFLGKPTGTASFGDLSMRERGYLLPVAVVILILGVYPKPLIELVRPTVLTLLSTVVNQ